MSMSVGRMAALAICTLSAATAVASNVPASSTLPARPARVGLAVDDTAPGDARQSFSASQANRTLAPVTVEEISAAELAVVRSDPLRAHIAPSEPSHRQAAPDSRVLERFDLRADFARDVAPTSTKLLQTAVPTSAVESSLGTVEHEPVLPALLPLGAVLVGLVALVALFLRPAKRETDPYFGG